MFFTAVVCPPSWGNTAIPTSRPTAWRARSRPDAPAWLIRELTPRNPGSRAYTTVVAAPECSMAIHDPTAARVSPGVEVAPELSEDLDGLPAILSELVPELDPSKVSWTRKEAGDQSLLVGRCPFPHASGGSNKADLAAGYNNQGRPLVKCKHSSCTGSKEADERLKAWHRQQTAAAAPKRELVVTPIAQSMLEDLAANRVAYHSAPTGAGKSFAIAQAAVARYRAGLCTCLSFPTLQLLCRGRRPPGGVCSRRRRGGGDRQGLRLSVAD